MVSEAEGRFLVDDDAITEQGNMGDVVALDKCWVFSKVCGDIQVDTEI